MTTFSTINGYLAFTSNQILFEIGQRIENLCFHVYFIFDKMILKIMNIN